MKVLQMIFLITGLLVSIQAQALSLIPNGKCAIVVASRETINDVRNYINEEINNKKHVTVYHTGNGWYAISLGFLNWYEKDSKLREFKADGKAPNDAFCTKGKSFLSVVDVDTSKYSIEIQRGHEGPILALKITSEGRKLISSGEDGKIIIWDLGNKRQKFAFKSKFGAVDHVAISDDDTYVVATYKGGYFAIININNGIYKSYLTKKGINFGGIGFSDNNIVLSGSKVGSTTGGYLFQYSLSGREIKRETYKEIFRKAINGKSAIIDRSNKFGGRKGVCGYGSMLYPRKFAISSKSNTSITGFECGFLLYDFTKNKARFVTKGTEVLQMQKPDIIKYDKGMGLFVIVYGDGGKIKYAKLENGKIQIKTKFKYKPDNTPLDVNCKMNSCIVLLLATKNKLLKFNGKSIKKIANTYKNTESFYMKDDWIYFMSNNEVKRIDGKNKAEIISKFDDIIPLKIDQTNQNNELIVLGEQNLIKLNLENGSALDNKKLDGYFKQMDVQLDKIVLGGNKLKGDYSDFTDQHKPIVQFHKNNKLKIIKRIVGAEKTRYHLLNNISFSDDTNSAYATGLEGTFRYTPNGRVNKIDNAIICENGVIYKTDKAGAKILSRNRVLPIACDLKHLFTGWKKEGFIQAANTSERSKPYCIINYKDKEILFHSKKLVGNGIDAKYKDGFVIKNYDTCSYATYQRDLGFNAEDKLNIFGTAEEDGATWILGALSPISFSFSSEFQKLAIGTWNNEVIIYDLTKKKGNSKYPIKNKYKTIKLKHHDHHVTSVLFSKDGKFLITASKDKRILDSHHKCNTS